MKNESLSEVTRHAPLDHRVEARRELVGRVTRHAFVVISKDRLDVALEEEVEWAVAVSQVRHRHSVNGRVHLGLEVVDPKLIEVAQHRIPGAVRYKAGPVGEGLAVVLVQVRTTLLHLYDDDRLPDQVSEGRTARLLPHPVLTSCFRFQQSRPSEGLEQPVEKDLRFALFVTLDVLCSPCREARQSCALF